MSKTKLTLDIDKSLENYDRNGGYQWHLPEVDITPTYKNNWVKQSDGLAHFQKGIVDAIRYKHQYAYNTETNRYEYNYIFICFEIKISFADFKSKNGHNFIGNENYYVIPHELYEKIKDLVPKNIGIILFKDGRLRKRKNCEFMNMENINKDKLLWQMITRQSIELEKLNYHIKYLEEQLKGKQ